MGAYVSAVQNKLDAVHDLVLALTARKTNTAADETAINPTLTALSNEADDLDAALSAESAPTLSGPSPAVATALQNAIKAAENAIAQDASTNALINAAVVLIGTMKGVATN
jgi:hypothetical protein